MLDIETMFEMLHLRSRVSATRLKSKRDACGSEKDDKNNDEDHRKDESKDDSKQPYSSAEKSETPAAESKRDNNTCTNHLKTQQAGLCDDDQKTTHKGGNEQIEVEFKRAAAFVKNDAPFGLSNNDKLTLYAYFKQATKGQCDQKKPSMFSAVAVAKWSKWNELGNLDCSEAKKQYIQAVQTFFPQHFQSSIGTNVTANDDECKDTADASGFSCQRNKNAKGRQTFFAASNYTVTQNNHTCCSKNSKWDVVIMSYLEKNMPNLATHLTKTRFTPGVSLVLFCTMLMLHIVLAYVPFLDYACPYAGKLALDTTTSTGSLLSWFFWAFSVFVCVPAYVGLAVYLSEKLHSVYVERMCD